MGAPNPQPTAHSPEHTAGGGGCEEEEAAGDGVEEEREAALCMGS